jgi:iron complex outermembrane receptor protein
MDAPGLAALAATGPRGYPARVIRILPLCLLAAQGAAQAQSAPSPDPATLVRVLVIATRAPGAMVRTPAAVSVLDGAALDTRGNGATLSEKLAGVPGVLARTRQNWAQDEQISIRGFGTRASFGIRSVRLYVDGIPATMPDGQGQVSHFPLGDAARIEVLRGPFAALYGNGAGGVVLLETQDGGAPTRVGVDASIGSFDTARVGANLRGGAGDVDYAIGASRFATDGYRDHSRATRTGVDAKLRMPLGDGRLTLVANAFDSPDTLDPQGLTREQVEADPRQASAGALRFDTRKSARQTQLGAVYERGGLHVLAYGGRRHVEQVLSTPPEAQRSPLSAGGWIDLDSPFAGIDARWRWHRELASRPLDVIAGLDVEQQRQSRHGYENFVGDAVGLRGALRANQQDRVRSLEPYLQATWDIGPAWSLSGGVRASRITFESDDAYVTAGNPDDSGRVRYSALSPVLGATWRPVRGVSLYGSLGRGFETPTFNELGYRSDGGSGPNFLLRPMRMRNAELGALLARDGLRAELAAFESDTRDELAVNTSVGGRTSFRNAGPTRHRRRAARADGRGVAARSQRHVARRRIPFDVSGLHRHRLPRTGGGGRGRHAAAGRAARAGVRRAAPRRRHRPAASARCAARRRRRRDHRGRRAHARLRAARREPRLARGPRARTRPRLPRHRQPARSPLRGLGDRQRCERPLLRAGCRTRADPRCRVELGRLSLTPMEHRGLRGSLRYGVAHRSLHR